MVSMQLWQIGYWLGAHRIWNHRFSKVLGKLKSFWQQTAKNFSYQYDIKGTVIQIMNSCQTLSKPRSVKTNILAGWNLVPRSLSKKFAKHSCVLLSKYLTDTARLWFVFLLWLSNGFAVFLMTLRSVLNHSNSESHLGSSNHFNLSVWPTQLSLTSYVPHTLESYSLWLPLFHRLQGHIPRMPYAYK
jgi:hypothetical protein